MLYTTMIMTFTVGVDLGFVLGCFLLIFYHIASMCRTTNTRQVSQAAESTGSDLSSHEDQIQSLMAVFNFSRAKAEEEVGRLNQIAQSPSAAAATHVE